MLSMHDEAQMAARALKVGAAGYATKDSDPALLLTAIRRVAGAGVISTRPWPTAWSSRSA
jgi:DNA-binding NarL/FixJ family response regulator